MLIFRRINCIFALNFNPESSYADYAFQAPAGKYELVLNTDDAEFDGFARLHSGESHLTVHRKMADGKHYEDVLMLYLPSRCALVLKKVD